MVQFQVDKVPGQRGHMIVQEDGTIISSSGELASNEMVSQQITTLIAHSLPVDFSRSASDGTAEVANNGNSGSAERRRASFHNAETGNSNGCSSPAGGSGDNSKNFKWNRITIEFGGTSYVACLSNRKVHLLKRSSIEPTATA